MKEQIIAKGTVHGFIKQKKSFNLKSLYDIIIKRGGILRVSMGVTVKDYLSELENNGIIEYSIDKNRYLVL